MDVLPYLEDIENIVHLLVQPPSHSLQRTETYSGASLVLSNYIAEPLECNFLGSHEPNLQNNPYYLIAISEQYKYIQSGIPRQGTKK